MLHLILGCGLENRLDAGKKVQYTRHPQCVENLGPSLLILDDSGVLHHGQVFGDRRDIGTHHLRELANASLPARQLVDDEKARRVAHGFDYLCARFES